METVQAEERQVKKGNERIFEILFEKDEITWQTLIMELVKKHNMDPWDVDISLLTQKYIDMLSELKEHDFRISGKVVLAAAILLKIKSNKLVGEDLDALDQLFAQKDEEEIGDLFDEPVEHPERQLFRDNKPYLLPRTPQPRKRKVSVFDLVNALDKALEVKRRRVLQNMPDLVIELPKKSRDISQGIKEVYQKITQLFARGKPRLTFTQLLPADTREDKIFTFIPLLHLSHLRKVQLVQDAPFSEIQIMARTEQEVDEVMGESE